MKAVGGGGEGGATIVGSSGKEAAVVEVRVDEGDGEAGIDEVVGHLHEWHNMALEWHGKDKDMGEFHLLTLRGKLLQIVK